MGAPKMPDPQRVLIAEDNPAIARMVAHDGRGALALARKPAHKQRRGFDL